MDGILYAFPGEHGGDRCHHRSDLFVAGLQEEARRPPVALHSHHIEPGLRLGEHFNTVELDIETASGVGVGEGGQPRWRLRRRIEIEAEFGERGEVGPGVGRGDDLVKRPGWWAPWLTVTPSPPPVTASIRTPTSRRTAPEVTTSGTAAPWF
jgi:hypothetical protein